jgi:hypothetical protein
MLRIKPHHDLAFGVLNGSDLDARTVVGIHR